MALATQCPHCHTTFRVASDQLKLRGGIVRCGTCQRIFDGNAHLIDLDALAAAKKANEAQAAAVEAAPVAEAPAAAEAPAPETPMPAAEPAADVGAQPVYTLDFDHTFDPFGILPKAEPTLDADADAAAGAEAGALPDAPAPLPEPAPAPIPEPVAEPAPEPAPEQAPLQDLDPTPAPAPAHAYAPAGRIEPSFDLPVDEALVAQPLRGHEPELEPDPEPEPLLEPHQAPPAAPDDAHAAAAAETDTVSAPTAALPLRASAEPDAPLSAADAGAAPRSARAKAIDARSRRSKLTPTRIEAPRLRVPASADTDEPEFVRRSRRQERSSKTVRVLMAVGAAVLLLLLAAQLLVSMRNELALRYPAARPLLGGLCAVAGCRVGLPAKAENLIIDEGELAPIGADTYSLNTTLRNQGNLVQAWPSLELELTDANNKPLLRRVFGPSDYLPAGAAAANGFGAHSEQPVRLNFALTDLKPSGYHTFVFYP